MLDRLADLVLAPGPLLLFVGTQHWTMAWLSIPVWVAFMRRSRIAL